MRGGGKTTLQKQIALPQRRQFGRERIQLTTRRGCRVDAVGGVPARVGLSASLGQFALKPLDRRLAVVQRQLQVRHLLVVVLGPFLGLEPLADEGAALLVQGALTIDVFVPDSSASHSDDERTMPAGSG